MLQRTTPLATQKSPKTPLTRDNPYRDMNQQKQSKAPVSAKQNPVTKTTPPVAKKEQKKTAPVVKNNPVVKNDKQVIKEEQPVKEKAKENSDIATKDQANKTNEIKSIQKPAVPGNFEKRTNKVLKTIEVEKEKINIELYDNGEIDGDSVSVFYNGKLLVSHKRLTDKPLSLTLELDDDIESNELTMYAENLGEIPPNTALMIVKDGNNRYEVRITSDTEKNGTIAFVKKKRQ